MIWKLSGTSHVSAPYRVEPIIRGFDVWLSGERRIGRDIKTLRAAKALAELHAKGDRRVPA